MQEQCARIAERMALGPWGDEHDAITPGALAKMIARAIRGTAAPLATEAPADREYLHPVNQVWFRAGLLACREYMARFVEAESPSIANSIRANWWPSLGADFGAPRQLAWGELTEGDYGTPTFRCRTADEVSPTQEALPIALGFLQQPIVASQPSAAPAGAPAPTEQPPYVHHCCKPSNLATAPPFAQWCSLEREYVDAAAKQFDYKCSHCGERITVNVQQWRTHVPVGPPARLQELLADCCVSSARQLYEITEEDFARLDALLSSRTVVAKSQNTKT